MADGGLGEDHPRTLTRRALLPTWHRYLTVDRVRRRRWRRGSLVRAPVPAPTDEHRVEEHDIGVVRRPSRVPGHEHEADIGEVHLPDGIRQTRRHQARLATQETTP